MKKLKTPPERLGGREREMIDTIFALGNRASAEEIRADFPTVTADALRAVVAFAAVSAEEDMPVPPMPAAA